MLRFTSLFVSVAVKMNYFCGFESFHYQCFSWFSAVNELVLCRSFGNHAHEDVWLAEAVVSSPLVGCRYYCCLHNM
uniref:Uncharacterized protein n=1 Tax=Trichobilharzia regenti TaxID=157069 RepID=A0AA85JUG1_TRIRE|nr:unnamed protein product [Trichobilharzia regenti]